MFCNYFSAVLIGRFVLLITLLLVFDRVRYSRHLTDCYWVHVQCCSCRVPYHRRGCLPRNLLCRLECQSSWLGSTICRLESLSCDFSVGRNSIWHRFFALLLRPWKITELKLSQSAQHIQAYSVKYCWTQVTRVSWVGLWMWLHPDVKLCCEWVLVLSHCGIVQSAVKTYPCVLTVTQTCRPASARKFNCWTCLWMSKIILVVILTLHSIRHRFFALLLRLWKKI